MSYFHPRKAFGNEDVIYKARQYENALQERVQFVHNYERLMRYAQFEQFNGPRSSHHSLAERLAAMREEREQALVQRRHKLSILLTGEDTILQKEINTGNMNLSQRRAWLLSQALARSSQGVPETNLHKALYEDYNQVSMHNSKLAIRRTEVERRRHTDKNADIRQGPGLDGSSLTGDKLEAANILQQHLFMVEQLREAEKAAVEEDMVSMHRTWLEEEEALKLKQLEQRHKDSVQARDILLCKAKEKMGAGESDQGGYVVAMAADKERGEEKELEELRAAHKREALAYVSQLKAVAERQGIEDEELQATIKATMSMQAADNQLLSCPGIAGHCKSMAAHDDDDYDQNQTSTDWGRIHDISSNQRTNIASDQLWKKDLVDVLESETRRSRAAQLVDQQVNRLASVQAGEKDYKKPNETRMKQILTSTDLPYPEPYYGRKAVNWYQ